MSSTYKVHPEVTPLMSKDPEYLSKTPRVKRRADATVLNWRGQVSCLEIVRKMQLLIRFSNVKSHSNIRCLISVTGVPCL